MGISLTTAVPHVTVKNLSNDVTTATSGTFEGSIGPRIHGNKTVGTISGTYELRNRGGRFTGNWDITIQNKSASGTMRGVFARHFLFGKITIAETNRTMPIVGFLGVRNETFTGRFMAPVGPALYFWGTHS